MSETPRIQLTRRRGDSWSIPVVIKDAAGVPIDVSGRTFAAQIRTSAKASTVLAEFTIDDSDASTGRLVLDLAASLTQDIPAGTVVTDLQETVGDTASTWWEAEITVERDVTRG